MSQQVLVSFKIGAYEDEVLCDVVPMQTSHILLGRLWQFDRSTSHDGRTDMYTFLHKGKMITLAPLTPKQVYEDQIKIQQECEKVDERKKIEKHERKERKRFMQNEREKVINGTDHEVKQEEKILLSAKAKDVRRGLLGGRTMLLFFTKEVSNHTYIFDSSLPSSFTKLLHDYEDVFLDDVSSGLPPIRGIEHQIDLIPGAPLPNRPAYRSNPEETKEIQKASGGDSRQKMGKRKFKPLCCPSHPYAKEGRVMEDVHRLLSYQYHNGNVSPSHPLFR